MPSNATDGKTDGNIGGRLSDYSLVQDQSIKPGLERGRAFLLRQILHSESATPCRRRISCTASLPPPILFGSFAPRATRYSTIFGYSPPNASSGSLIPGPPSASKQ